MDEEIGSIQWVIDALGNALVKKKTHENHKYDSIRADQDIKWCPDCEKKWNIFEGRLWSSSDIPLWDKEICPSCKDECWDGLVDTVKEYLDSK